MISLQLRDVPFEQDVRELFMAFFPGETFSHVPEQDAMISCAMEAHREAAIAPRLGTYRAEIRTATGQNLSFESSWMQERIASKNELKRALYRVLAELTGKALPWGTLTGIRPAKLALTALQQGKTAAEIRADFKRDYYLSDARNALCVRTAENELRAIQGLDFAAGYSLYIGIPFCPTTCLYCSFPSYPAGKNKAAAYLAALREELRLTAEGMADRRLDAIYVGGGTPTSLTAEELRELLSFVRATFDLSSIRELTVEAGRPDSITREKLLVLQEEGVNRISINPQTMKQATLDLIGRFHTVEQFKESFQLARELGFMNINTDLIMGLPNESEADVRRTMEGIRALAPDDVTLHSLALKRAARLNTRREDYADVRYGDASQMVELAASYCEEMGLSPYYLYRQKNMAGNLENVGWCRPGKEGLYNILMMEELETIVGCGAGTTTRIMRGAGQYERLENVKDPALYVERLPELLAKKRRALAGDVLRLKKIGI